MTTARHILVVDDDAIFAESIRQILCGAGHEVSVATHFEPALKALESDPAVDILITDVVMPGSVNGLALSRMARMRRPDVKTIYLTGFDLGAAESEASGPILRKPVEVEVLLATVREILLPFAA